MSAGTIGIYLNGLPMNEVRRYARTMDERGFHSAWFPEIAFNDGITPIAVVGAETRHLKLGPAIVGPWGRSPVVMALTFASLAQIAPARIILGLGTQARPYVENWHGRVYERPLAAMREYITIVKRILAGELTTHEGDIFRVRNFQLSFPPPQPAVPVYMAAIGPKMIELAGEIADGVIGAFWSVPYVEKIVMPRLRAGAARAGRSLDGFQICVDLPTLITPDDSGFDLHKGQVLQFSTADRSSPAYAESIAAAGFADALVTIKDCVARRDYDAAFAAIGHDMVDALTLSGTPDHVRARIATYADAGITLMQCMPTPPGAFYPFYEGHLEGAPFPALDFPAFLGVVDRLIDGLGN